MIKALVILAALTYPIVTGAIEEPLRRGIPPNEILLRLVVVAIGSTAIMLFCGWISWCIGTLDNNLRFYGGLFGGLSICGLLFYWLIGREILWALAQSP